MPNDLPLKPAPHADSAPKVPVVADAATTTDPYEKTAYSGPSEMKEPGGWYIRGARQKGAKLFGGCVGDAHGKVLATFADDQENTGNPADGKAPE